MKHSLLALLLFLSILPLLPSCSQSSKNPPSQGSLSDSAKGVTSRQAPVADSLFTQDDFQGISLSIIKEENLLPYYPSDTLKVKFHTLGRFSTENKAFIEAVGRNLELVMNSQDFYSLVTHNTYTENKGYTSSQIFNLIMEAKEKKHRAGNLPGVMDFRINPTNRPSCYNTDPRTLGAHDSNNGFMYTCINYINEQRSDTAIAEVSGHYAHEYLHALGFRHDTVKSTSVPYKVGNMVRLLTLDGIEVKGKVTQNLTFETKAITGEKKQYAVYSSHMFASPLETI